MVGLLLYGIESEINVMNSVSLEFLSDLGSILFNEEVDVDEEVSNEFFLLDYGVELFEDCEFG